MARYHFTHRKPQRRRIRFSRVLLVLLLFLLVAYPFLEAHLILLVDQRTVHIAGLHPNLRNLKILFVSDIHQGPFFSQARVNNLIHKINGLSPDIVIFGGDYAQDSESAVHFFQNAPAVQARLGIYGVVGDSDRDEENDSISQLIGEMKNYGCLPLVNNVADIKVGQTYMYIAGSDDFLTGSPAIGDIASQVGKDAFVIFVGHSPDLLPAAFAAKSREGDTHWFDLALFGHTHGGQLTLFGNPLLPGKTLEIGNRYLTGWREENRAHILVSNGVGTDRVPARLFAFPQLHLITLKSR